MVLFIGIPKNKKYLQNIHRYALRFEARGPNRKSSFDFIIVLPSMEMIVSFFRIDIVKGISCGG